MRAMRAGHRGVFDDGDLGVILAELLVRQRARLQQFCHIDIALGFGNLGGSRRGGLCGSGRIRGLHIRRLGLLAGVAAGGKQGHRRNGGQRRQDVSARQTFAERRTVHTNHLTRVEFCYAKARKGESWRELRHLHPQSNRET